MNFNSHFFFNVGNLEWLFNAHAIVINDIPCMLDRLSDEIVWLNIIDDKIKVVSCDLLGVQRVVLGLSAADAVLNLTYSS